MILNKNTGTGGDIEVAFDPIAFNGGGIFYAYDFRYLKNIQLVAVSAGDLEYESAVVIGNNLDEALSKNTNIEAELY